MNDACGCSDETTTTGMADEEKAEGFWQVTAVRTRRIMLQNVGLSLYADRPLVPLALFGILRLAAVILIHERAEILVIITGVRARKIPRKNLLDAKQPGPVLEPAA